MGPTALISLVLLGAVAVEADGGFSKGREFVVGFMYNYGVGEDNVTANYVFISSEADGTVQLSMSQVASAPPWKSTHNLTGGTTLRVDIPNQSEMPKTMTLEPRGITITSDVDISVYAMNDNVNASAADAAEILPVSALSVNYVIPTPSKNPIILVAGVTANTVVTVSLASTCSIKYKGHTYKGGSTFTETVGKSDVFQIISSFSTKSSCDFAGTAVNASQPVAVYSGSACFYTTRSAGCDHFMEQVVPNELLGDRFIIPDLFDNSNYKVKVVAAFDSTHIFVYEHHKDFTVHSYQQDIDKGNFREYTVPDGTTLEIFSNNGIHVTQYDGSSTPFSIPIPPVKSYGWNYTFSTMDNPTSKFFISYINLVVDSDSAPFVTIDGSAVDPSKWQRVRDLGYSVAIVSIPPGNHRIEADDNFMAQVYGYDGVSSYAFQGGYYFDKLPPHHAPPTRHPGPHTPTPATTVTTCVDSPGVDCKVLNASIGICTNPDGAKHYCPKFCNLCSDCTSPGSCLVG
ncbi:IgGFc-binding protein-like isoform X1 [Haliotis rufescens]|uniref:IgGFc-binding protein-like isoform X1 n=1 Tax=Haliotis rufescens TaxID=6454 RepID=UPI00201F6857|nr:IgGFc-binding protein-like isoform X1 [Haliotis rufescens]